MNFDFDFVTPIVENAKSFGIGLIDMAKEMSITLFFDVDATTSAVTGLSAFGYMILAFSGIAVGAWVFRKIFSWLKARKA